MAKRAKAAAQKTNRFPGRCHCGGTVPAGEGILSGRKGNWIVSHHPGQCTGFTHNDYLETVHPFSEEAFEAPVFYNAK